MFSSIKAWLLAAGAVVIAVLVGLLKFFAEKAERAEETARAAEAKVRQDAAIRIRDKEITRQQIERRRQAEKDKDAGKIPDNLRNSNDW